jgi:putative DNA primase/helicase
VKLFRLESFAKRPATDAAGAPIFEPGAALDAGDDAADLAARGWTAAHLAKLIEAGELLTASGVSKFSRTGAGAVPERNRTSTPAEAEPFEIRNAAERALSQFG